MKTQGPLVVGIFLAPVFAWAGTPCEDLAHGPLGERASVEAPLAYAYSNNDGICMARVSIAMLARHQGQNALATSMRAVQVTPSDPLPYLARGLAQASTIAVEMGARGLGSPQLCEATRMSQIVADLSIAVLIGNDVEAARAALAAIQGLAIQCEDRGPLTALAATIALTYPAIPVPLLESFASDGKQAGGLTGAIIQSRSKLEIAGKPASVSVLVRRGQYRWLLAEWFAKERGFMRRLEGQMLARALGAVDLELGRSSSAHAGLVLEDMDLVSRIGGLHYLPVIDPVGEWLPWLANAKVGPIEEKTLRRLEMFATHHERAPGVALLAFKLRLVLALAEDNGCKKARGIAQAMNRFAGSAQEISVERFAPLVKEAATAGREAINQCSESGFIVHSELSAALERIAKGGQPYPALYNFMEP